KNVILEWYRWWALAVLVAGGGPSLGSAAQQTASPGTNLLTMAEAIRLGLENNPELRASSGRVDAAAGRAYQAKLWSNPELTLSAEDWPTGGGGLSEAKKLVGLAQTVPFPGKKKLDKDIGSAGVRVTEADLNLRRLELVREVKLAFFQVLAAERLVEVSGELVRVAESSAATARKRVAAGAAADQEQLRAEIPLEQAKTELSGFQRDLVTSRQTLALLLGRPDLTDVPVSGALAETVNLAVLDQGPELWLSGHPSVVAAKTSRERAELELRRARLEPYPDVKVGISGGEEDGRGGSIVQFGLSLPLPIIDRSKGKKQEARANAAIAEADSAVIEQRLLRAWGTVSQRLRTAVGQAASYRERILPKANEALRLVQMGFEQGKFGFIDLLDTQRTAAEARLAYLHKLLELNVAQAELEALLPRNSDAAKPVESHPLKPKE
ncbi:MAG: TolC family protein, partial [Verrucomicrobia bacterium]|nr:TolC family protein [Verrucomicrobiota bacterium]